MEISIGISVGKSSVNPLVIKKYYYRCVSKSVGNNFFITKGKKITDERFTDEAFLSVISLVN